MAEGRKKTPLVARNAKARNLRAMTRDPCCSSSGWLRQQPCPAIIIAVSSQTICPLFLLHTWRPLHGSFPSPRNSSNRICSPMISRGCSAFLHVRPPATTSRTSSPLVGPNEPKSKDKDKALWGRVTSGYFPSQRYITVEI